MSALTEYQAKKIQEYVGDEYGCIVPLSAIVEILDSAQSLPPLVVNTPYRATPENIARLPRGVSCYSVDVNIFFGDKSWTKGAWNFVKERWEDPHGNHIGDIRQINIVAFLIPSIGGAE